MQEALDCSDFQKSRSYHDEISSPVNETHSVVRSWSPFVAWNSFWSQQHVQGLRRVRFTWLCKCTCQKSSQRLKHDHNQPMVRISCQEASTLLANDRSCPNQSASGTWAASRTRAKHLVPSAPCLVSAWHSLDQLVGNCISLMFTSKMYSGQHFLNIVVEWKRMIQSQGINNRTWLV